MKITQKKLFKHEYFSLVSNGDLCDIFEKIFFHMKKENGEKMKNAFFFSLGEKVTN
jgi:hypothetical protein